MNNLLSVFLIASLLLSSCKKNQNRFEIGKQHIGVLTDSTKIENLKTIFINDSVSNLINENGFKRNISSIEVFEKGGKKLLVITPRKTSNPKSTIKSIQIIDPRYKTNKNISILSTFKDISNVYKISKISNLINSVVITVNDLNTSFVIDKKELPANIRFDMNLNIEPMHIPDTAKIKYFFINWNNKK